jgi:hypothetical protein
MLNRFMQGLTHPDFAPDDNPVGALGLPRNNPADLPAAKPEAAAADAPKPEEPMAPAPEPQVASPDQKPEVPPAVVPVATPKPEAEPPALALLKQTQKAHQEKMAVLKERFPDVYSELTGKTPEPPAPAPALKSTPARAEDDDKRAFSDEELEDILDGRSTRKVTVAQLVAELRKAFKEEIEGVKTTERKSLTDNLVARELSESQEAAKQLIHATDAAGNHLIPDSIIKEASERIDRYRIPIDTPGGPTAMFEAFTREIQYLMQVQGMGTTAADIAAAEAAKVKANMLGLQPAPSPTPPAKEQTKEDKEVGAIEAAGRGTFSALLSSSQRR